MTEVHTSLSAAGFRASESRLRNRVVSNLLAKSKNYDFRGFRLNENSDSGEENKTH